MSISALTTIAGFGFLGMSHYPALARMGTFTAVSLFLCLVASMTLLPALFAVLGAPPGLVGTSPVIPTAPVKQPISRSPE